MVRARGTTQVYPENGKRIADRLEELRAYRGLHVSMGKDMLQDSLYAFDLLAIAVLNRSVNLLLGFCDLLEHRNMIAAAPLLRLQLDNCLRFSASWLVENPDAFATAVLGGIHIDRQVDRFGKRLTDAHLVHSLSSKFPWVASVYRQTSGFIHLSEKHMCISTRAAGVDTINSRIGWGDDFVTEGMYLEAIDAFQAATDLLFRFVKMWVSEKESWEAAEP